jgi:hypothetical protein
MQKIKLTVYANNFIKKDIKCIPYSDFAINVSLKLEL